MRQRLGLAAALLHAPRLLVLDEPTNGLDPRGIAEVRELLVELNRGGTTVFLSSHLLAEIEALCTRVGVVDRGRLVAEDELHALVAPTGRYDVHTPDVEAAAGLLGRAVVAVDRDRLLVAAPDPVELNRCLVEHGVRVSGLGPERRTLEDVVLELTGAGNDRTTARTCRRDRRRAAEAFRRPRTWVGLLLLVALPSLVAFFLAVSENAPRPGTGPAFLSAVLSNGALFPAAALAIVLPLFLPVSVAVVAGDAIAGEAQAGTLRYLLVRPVGRTRLLLAKLVSLLAFTLAAVVAVAVSAYVVGVGLFGSAPVPSTSGPEFTTSGAALRITLTVLYVGWSMVGVGAVTFPVHVTDSALAAALGAIGLLVASSCWSGWRRRRGVQPVPADPLLAGLRRLLPRPRADPRDRARRGAAGGVRHGVPGRRLGQPDAPRTSRGSPLRQTGQPAGVERRGAERGPHQPGDRRVARQLAVGRRPGPGQTSCTASATAPRAAREVGRRHTSRPARSDRQVRPARPASRRRG